MCGLVGVVNVSGGQLTDNGVKLFKQLLYFDVVRGDHSTGVCSILSKEEARIHKHLGPPSKESTWNVGDLIPANKNPIGLLGHNRFATKGEVNVANAHPFISQNGKVIGAHNGTVYQHILDRLGKNPYETDSEFIYNNIAEKGLPETVKELEFGAYALTWWDTEEKSFNILRNTERPLYACSSGNALIYASEKWMIEVAASRCNVSLGEIWAVLPHKHLKYTVGNITPEVREVKPERKVYHFQYGGFRNTNNKNTTPPTSYTNKEPTLKISELQCLLKSNVRIVTKSEETDKSGHKYFECEIKEVMGPHSMDLDFSKIKVRAYLNGSKQSRDLLEELFEEPTTPEGEEYFLEAKIKKLKCAENTGQTVYGVLDLRTVTGIEYFPNKDEEDDEEEARKAWDSLTKDGCCFCCSSVEYEDKDTVQWVGKKEFFCEDCVKGNVPAQYGLDNVKVN